MSMRFTVVINHAGGQRASLGMPSQTERGAQREGLVVRGAAMLVEAKPTLPPLLVKVRVDAGGAFGLSDRHPYGSCYLLFRNDS